MTDRRQPMHQSKITRAMVETALARVKDTPPNRRIERATAAKQMAGTWVAATIETWLPERPRVKSEAICELG
jgi:hypothetical protein